MADLRRNTRINQKIDGFLYFSNSEEEERLACLVEDISTGGFGVTLPYEREIPNGTDVEVQFSFSMSTETAIMKTKSVVRMCRIQDGGTILGLQAIDTPEEMESLKEFWLGLLFEEMYPGIVFDYFAD